MQLLSKNSYLFGAFTRERYATQRNITKQGNWFYGFGNIAYSFDGTHDPLELFLTNPALNHVVGKIASYTSNAVFYVDNGGEKDFNGNPITELLNSPNPEQSKQDFIRQWVIYNLLYGFAPIFDKRKFTRNRYDINNTEALYALNPKHLKSYKRNLFDYLLITNKDTAYEYNEYVDGYRHNRKFRKDELFLFYDGANGVDGDYLKGYSRVKSLEVVLDNVRKSLEGENVILGNPGGFGIISNQTQDSAGHMSFRENEKEEIEAKMSNNGQYGNQFGQHQWIATDKNLKPFQFNSRLKDYTYNENYKDNLLKVASAFGLPKELVGFDDTKYENKDVAEVQLYTSVCQTIIDNLCQTLSNNYDLAQPVRATYEFVPSVASRLFEGKKKQAEQIDKATDVLAKLYTLGVSIDQIEEQYQELTGYKIEINEEVIQERSRKIESQNSGENGQNSN